MALNAGGIFVKVGANIDGFKRGMREADSAMNAFGHRSSSVFGKVAKVALLAGGAIGGTLVVAAKKAVTAYSDLNEQLNKATVVFAGNEKEVIRWSGSLVTNFGLSKRAALEAAGTFGNMLVPMGFARNEASKMSMKMVELAGDMASFNNASPEDTLMALRSGLAGEIEPLRKFGVFLSDARMKQEALNLGLYNGKGNLDSAAKAAATYAIILKDTADTQGDFARTSDGLANTQRILRASAENLAAAFGKGIYPSVQKAAGALSEFLEKASTKRAIEHMGVLLNEKIGGASRALMDFWHKNGDTIRNVLEGAWDASRRFKEILFDLLGVADKIVKAIGGWKLAFEALIASAVILKVSGGFRNIAIAAGAANVGAAAGVAGVAGGGTAGLLRSLSKLAKIGAIGITISIIYEEKEKIGDFLHRIGDAANKALGLPEGFFPFSTGIPKSSQGIIDKSKALQPRVGVGVQIPSSFKDTHGSRLLPAFSPAGPAVDIGFNTGGGVTILSPNEATRVWRISGKSPSLGGKSGGAYGYSVYLVSPTGTYFITHLEKVFVKPGQLLQPGTPVGSTANASVAGMAASASHAHVEKTRDVAIPVGKGPSPADTSVKTGTVKPDTDEPSITDIPFGLRVALTKAERRGGVAGLRAQIATQRSLLSLFTKRLKGVSPEDRAELEEARTTVLGKIEDLQKDIAKKQEAASEKLLELAKAQRKKLRAFLKQDPFPEGAGPAGSGTGMGVKLIEGLFPKGAGPTGVGLLGEAALSWIDRMKKRAKDKLSQAIDTLRTAVQDKRSAFSSAFGSLMDKALRVFDRKTQELIAKARAKVARFGFEIGVGEETPAEQKLREFRAARDAEQVAQERADAMSIEDPVERNKRLRELDLRDQENSLAQQANAERQAADESLRIAQQEIQDARDAEREAFGGRMSEIQTLLATGKITASEARRMVAETFGTFGVAVDAATVLSLAFADAYTNAFDAMIDKLQELIDKTQEFNELAGIPAGAIAGGRTNAAPVRLPHGWFRGGVPELAHGGIVTSPTLAMIGESGPEAVIPLSRGGGTGQTVILNVLMPNYLGSRREAAHELLGEMDKISRSGGALFTRTAGVTV